MITKVSNFVLSSLIARLAPAMVYIVINLWVLVIWEELYVVLSTLIARLALAMLCIVINLGGIIFASI